MVGLSLSEFLPLVLCLAGLVLYLFFVFVCASGQLLFTCRFGCLAVWLVMCSDFFCGWV